MYSKCTEFALNTWIALELICLSFLGIIVSPFSLLMSLDSRPASRKQEEQTRNEQAEVYCLLNLELWKIKISLGDKYHKTKTSILSREHNGFKWA